MAEACKSCQRPMREHVVRHRLTALGDEESYYCPDKPYAWRAGDVFTDGKYRWYVTSMIEGDKAVLRSCSTTWATTRPLTFNEWREGGRWRLESEGTP